MAARSLERLGKTVQISTAGIAPEQGVGNRRPQIDQALLCSCDICWSTYGR